MLCKAPAANSLEDVFMLFEAVVYPPKHQGNGWQECKNVLLEKMFRQVQDLASESRRKVSMR
jgi:hypothetical protein